MSTAAPSTSQRIGLFYGDFVGKKVAMALSGVVLFGYVIAHMIGNLQIFLGKAQINAYAETLHASAALLWTVRVILLAAVAVHFYTGLSLVARSRAARPVAYKVKGQRRPNLAARTMALSGLVIGAFVVYHLLHLTTGTVHPGFIALDPFDNMVRGFQVPAVAIAYVVSVCLLGLHLYHGAWSMFQSVGVSHPRYTPALKRFAATIAVVLALGFAAVPLSVLFGLIR